MLHIGLDGSRIAKDKYTGTENYSHTIFEHLFRVAPHHRYTVYAPKMPSKPLDTGRAQVDYRIIPFPKLWTQIRLSWEFLTRPQPDVFFVPSHTIPLIHPKEVVNTVHDLGFEHFPQYYNKIERIYQRIGLWQATRASRRLIAVSESTKQDLTRFTNYPADHIHVIHHGVDRERFFPAISTDIPPKKIQSSSPYFYYIGRLEAKKNIVRLIQAFRTLKEKHAVPHKLVLAGKPGQYGYEEIQQTLEQLPVAILKDVLLQGYVSDHDYAIWLRFAEALVFPSGFEGFGLPALEAMASGVPAIVSRNSSLPEIVGNAGLLVNETKAEAIANAMQRIITDPALRKQLVKRGLEQAKQFTWEAAARKTVSVLELVAQQTTHSEK
jgi:glycosyltransferase involved in cell wall biosynthesis